MATLIEESVGCIQPFAINQSGPLDRCVITKIDFHVVISGYALIAASPEGIEIVAVQRVNDIRDVLPVVVDGSRDLVRRGDSCDCQLRSWNHETFVDKYFRSFWMIHDHQAEM